MATDTITVYEAVREMQRITECGGEFSFSFFKYDRERKAGGDLARISRAKLRPKTDNNTIANSDHKLFFTDLDAAQSLVCWQLLIYDFNNIKCTI